MKKWVSAFLVLVLVLGLAPSPLLPTALAAGTSGDGLWEWEPYGDGVQLTKYLGSQTDVLVPATVEAEGEMYSVIKLGDGLFQNRTSLNSATLGEGIQEIGASAFDGASNLVCIVTPQSLITIGERAFAGCGAFNSVILYDAVSGIGVDAFDGCSALTIYCNQDSTAHQYAVEHGITSVVMNPSTEPEIWEEDGITYYIMNGSAVAVSSDETQLTVDVTIPATVNGCPVTELRGTFKENENLKSVVLPNSVTAIGDKTFYLCRNMENVNIPSGVTKIGEYAFSTCIGLAQIDLPDSLTTIGSCAFSYCDRLAQIALPDSLTTIGRWAFERCNAVTRVTIPSACVLEYGAFEFCSVLEEVILSEGIAKIESRVFGHCANLKTVSIPSSVTEIEYGAFENCTSLYNIVIPDRATAVRSNAFKGCSSLHKLMIPASVEEIYSDSLSDNTIWIVTENSPAHRCAEENDRLYIIWDGTNEPELYEEDGITYYIMNGSTVAVFSDVALTDVTIPAEVQGCPVTELRGTFKGNENLTSVTLPDSVVIIGDETFSGCQRLESVNMPSGVTKIGEYAFSYCGRLVQIALPDSLTTIGSYAFMSCNAPTRVTIPSACVLKSSAFQSCPVLEEVILSEGITKIEDYAFGYCANLKTVSIPGSVTEIGSGAFENCTSLYNIVIPDRATAVRSNAFKGCSSLRKLVIPASVEEIYSDSLSDNTIWIVTENSPAHRCAEENDRLYIIWDGTNEPELYEEDGITYYIMNGSAVAVFSDAALTDVTIPAEVQGCPVTELRGTFKGNENLTSVTLPDSVVCIGDETFSGCQRLESVNIPSGVTKIGEYAFSICIGLAQIDLPDSLTAIGSYAFSYCDRLAQIALPDSLTTIGSCAFESCNAVTRVTIPSACVLEYGVFNSCSVLEEAILSEGIAKIESRVFGYCANLKTVFIPSSVTEIEYGAFENCTSLYNIVIPDCATAVRNDAFKGCSSLQKLVIPASVQLISSDCLPDNAVWIVTEDSPAHRCAEENNCLYFVLPNTGNPEIAYGTEITGSVTYTDGTVASNVDVEILYDNGTIKERVKTDESGDYTLTYVEAGRYTIRASDGRGSTQSETVSVKRMNVFSVFLTGETDLVLKRGYTVSGTVSPAGANVTLTDLEGRVIASESAADGNYALADIPNGSYLLKAETQTGSVLREIRVYNADVTEDLVVPANSASISGAVLIAERDGSQSPAVWARVSLYNSEGVLTAQTRSDAAGNFTVGNLPLGDFAIVAETTQMRPDSRKGYVRSHTLTGYAYVSVTEYQVYDAGTITLYEEGGSAASISGKVTANGETQNCMVTLVNAFRFGVAVTTTGKNGRYTFKNIPDGLYFITAVTGKLGMGITVVVVRGGVVHGETDIQVYKSSRVLAWEEDSKLPDIQDAEAKERRADIAEEKERYDSLSEKERQQLDQDYLRRLNSLAEAAVDYSVQTPEGFTLENGGTLISKEEIAGGHQVTLALTVEELPAYTISGDGIKTERDYVQQMIEDAAGDTEITGYYDLSLTKNGREISDIAKQTDTAGKLRITMDIPQQYRGHTRYSMVHIHNGEPTTLVDLDENPNTATFEMDQFSICALTCSDVSLTEKLPLTLDAYDVALKPGETASVHASVESGSIQTVTASPTDASVVTASVEGSIITLTPVAVGKTTVEVRVTVEGLDMPLADTITVQVLPEDADGYVLALSEADGQISAAVSGPQTAKAKLFAATYDGDGRMLAVVCLPLQLEAEQEQRIPLPLDTGGASRLAAFLTDDTSRLCPLAEAASVSVPGEK